jgi:transposase
MKLAAGDGCGSRTSALFEGCLTRPSPVDRARIGSKHHLLVDAAGVPLAVTLTSAGSNDVTQLLPLVDGIMPVSGKVGRPRQQPDRIVADRGYDHDSYRRELWRRGVKPSIAHRGTEHGSGLGRWVGLSSGPSRGCTTTVAYASAGNATRWCMWPSSPSPARLSAGATSWGFETGS